MSLIALPTGSMMTTVMKMARLTMIWFGGICGVPMAWRRKWKTMMIRVKEVTVRRIAGASESTVSMNRISSSMLICSGSLWPADSCRESPGKPPWARAGAALSRRRKRRLLAAGIVARLGERAGEGLVSVIVVRFGFG